MDNRDCLAHYPFVVLRIRCRVCSRKGSYIRARIAAKFVPEISLRDLPGAMRAKRPRLGDFDVEAQLGRRPQGIGLRSSAPGGELMHLKGYCVDHRLLRTGSANLSRSGETRQDNDLVALRGASVCARFEAKFENAWARS